MARRKTTLTQRLMKATKKNVAKKIKIVSKRVNKQTRRVSRFLKSDSLARGIRRKTKAAKRQAKKNNKALKRIGKRRLRQIRGRLKKLPGQKRKAKRFFRKQLQIALKSKTRFFKSRNKAKKEKVRLQKRQARELRKSQTQIDLTGQADITGAVVRRASGDPGASKPGEPPKMRTGKGRTSIKAQLRMAGKKLTSRVYVDKKIAGYMAMWEFRQDGKQRPFLKPSVENNKDQFGAIIGSELKRSNRGGKRKAVVK